MGLDGGVRRAVEEVVGLEDLVGLREFPFQVAKLELDAFEDVAAAGSPVDWLVDEGLGVIDGEHWWENLILDHERVDGSNGQGLALGRDGSHGVANVSRFVETESVLVTGPAKNPVGDW